MKLYALVREEMGECNVVLAIFDEKNCISKEDLDRLNASRDYSYGLDKYEINEFDIEDEL